MNRHRSGGFTLVEVSIVTLIIGLMASIAFPALGHARTRSQRGACINNLRQIESAKDQWSLETNAAEGSAVTADDLAPFFRGSFPQCPAGGVYDLGVIGVPASCSISSHVLP